MFLEWWMLILIIWAAYAWGHSNGSDKGFNAGYQMKRRDPYDGGDIRDSY